MVNPHDGALTFEQPSLRIGPALKRSEFLTADWAQGAASSVVNEPWHSWKLDGQYWSMSLPFKVIVYFEGEQLTSVNFCNSDPKFGTSWADYSEEKERQRQESHDVWLSKCLGEQRSFPWGTVSSSDGHDPHGGGASSIIISYSALPPGGTLQKQGGGSTALKLRGDGNLPVTGEDTSSGRDKNVPGSLPPAPRRIRRRWYTIGHAVRHFLLLGFFSLCALLGIVLTLVIPIRLVVTTYGAPVVATIDATDFVKQDTDNDYYVTFHYFSKGQMRSDRQQVTFHDYTIAQAGQQVPARAMQFGTWTMCVAMIGDVNWFLIKTHGKMLLLIDSVVVLILWIGLGSIALTRRLVREGAPVIGALIGKRVLTGSKLPVWYVRFKFKTSEGVEMKNEIIVTFAAYKSAQVGAAVTVLYDPARPAKSVAYEYCGYEVVPLAR